MAKEYIDREVAKTFLQKTLKDTISDAGVEGIVRESYELCIEHTVSYFKFIPPAADVAEVRHGKWISYKTDESYGPYDTKAWYKCSECGKDAIGRCYQDEYYSCPNLSDYCPNCGAKMDGKDE